MSKNASNQRRCSKENAGEKKPPAEAATPQAGEERTEDEEQ
jgi:hypothetical protein